MTEHRNHPTPFHQACWKRIPMQCPKKTAWACTAGGGALLLILQLLSE